jgi:hypothetical protein
MSNRTITIDEQEAQVLLILDAGVVHSVNVCKNNISALLAACTFYGERDDESELLASAKRLLDCGQPMACEEVLECYVANSENRFTFSIHSIEYMA